MKLCVDLLKPDDKPTLTRFFTFRVCIDSILTMIMIGMPQAALKVLGIKMRTVGQTRLRKVSQFSPIRTRTKRCAGHPSFSRSPGVWRRA